MMRKEAEWTGAAVSVLSVHKSLCMVSGPEVRAPILLSFLHAQSSWTLCFSSHCFLHSTSAEAVAMGLLKQFEGMQLPAASELEWLVPEHDAPQKVDSSSLFLHPASSPRRL